MHWTSLRVSTRAEALRLTTPNPQGAPNLELPEGNLGGRHRSYHWVALTFETSWSYLPFSAPAGWTPIHDVRFHLVGAQEFLVSTSFFSLLDSKYFELFSSAEESVSPKTTETLTHVRTRLKSFFLLRR